MSTSRIPSGLFALLLTLAVFPSCDQDHKHGVEVNPVPPAEIGGMELRSPQGGVVYREFGSAGAALRLQRRDVRDSLRIQFLGPAGAAIQDSALLNSNTEVRCGTTPEGILRASLSSGLPFGIRLEAISEGPTRLGVSLLREDRIVYSSLGIDVSVIALPSTGWDGFGESNAPDGAVREMTVYRGGLVMAGEFTRVGPVTANGVAIWDGHAWSAMAGGSQGMRWLLTEDDALVAGGPDIGFHQWDGTQWTQVAGSCPAAATAALLGHEVYVTGWNTAVMVWRDGSWQTVATDRYMDGHALVAHQGALYLGATAYRHAMLLADTYVARVVGDTLVRIFTVPAPGEASSMITHLKSHGPDLLMAWFSDYLGHRGGAVAWIRSDEIHNLAADAELVPRGSAVVEGTLCVVDKQTVQVHEGNGWRPLAVAEGGEIFDAEEFQGSLYVCGSFSAINEVPSFRIACWTPPSTTP
jgi:hypothetical protein